MHDVFISHATEDKDTFVRPLALALVKRGVAVWYDEFSMSLGDSLRQSIDMGLSKSRFGVVVLSPSFFGKGWAERELNGLTVRDVKAGGEGIILPVWHGVNSDTVMNYSPPLADKVAVKSSEGVDAVCEKIIAVVRPDLVASKPSVSGPASGASGRVTAYILSTLRTFVAGVDSGFDWSPHVLTIYSSHRQLALTTIEQLAEAVADRASQIEVEDQFRRLLGRSADAVGKTIYTPWVFLLGEQGKRAVEASIMASPEYRSRKSRNRVGLPSPPGDYVPDPMTEGPSLPTGWDGDAWVKPDGSGYFLRAWHKGSGRYAIGSGARYTEAREKLVHDVQHGTQRAVVRTTIREVQV